MGQLYHERIEQSRRQKDAKAAAAVATAPGDSANEAGPANADEPTNAENGGPFKTVSTDGQGNEHAAGAALSAGLAGATEDAQRRSRQERLLQLKLERELEAAERAAKLAEARAKVGA